MGRLNILFICQVVDVRDPIMATAVQWIETLSNDPRVHHVTVLSLRDGEHAFGDRVTVKKFGGGGRLLTLIRFYRCLLNAMSKNRISSFLIYQGGAYPLLLLPFKKILNIPIFHWRAHPHVSAMARFYVDYCTTVHFTSTKSAFIERPNVKRVGQGVNIDKFRAMLLPKKGDLITLGRVSPIKRVELMIEAVDFCQRKYQRRLTLYVYGPVFPADEEYFSMLREMVKSRGLGKQIIFRGAVNHDQLPELLNEHALSLNFCKGALGRAVVEAMACGIPVISSNTCVGEIMPEKYKENLMVMRADGVAISKKINEFFLLKPDYRKEMSLKLRENIVRNHSHTSQIDKIVSEMILKNG